jgi:hypothetical protein
MMNYPELFKKQNYLTMKGVVPLDLCRIVTKYALLKEENEFLPDEGPEAQVENAHAVYADTLMETMMHFMHPHMENYTGLSLCPTYSYYRVYRPGMELTKHRDRESCEISTTVCFGFNYQLKDENYRWGMYVEPDVFCPQDPGDLIIYRGCDITHWREQFDAAPSSYQVQAFFHYINKDGPYYPEFKYDRRQRIGQRSTKRINN